MDDLEPLTDVSLGSSVCMCRERGVGGMCSMSGCAFFSAVIDPGGRAVDSADIACMSTQAADVPLPGSLLNPLHHPRPQVEPHQTQSRLTSAVHIQLYHLPLTEPQTKIVYSQHKGKQQQQQQ